MSALEAVSRPPPAPWTCPFCALLCDGFQAGPGSGAAGATLALTGSDCPRAAAALARFAAAADKQPTASASIDGRPCTLDEAIAAAARRLAASRQPLFGGLGTDVAGARALYPLACRTGAIAEAAGGAVLMQVVRALQDRGGYTTTLAEVHTRADLVLCVGALPAASYPEFLRRCAAPRDDGTVAQVVVLGADAATGAGARLPAGAPPIAWLPAAGDLFDTVALLAALVAQRGVAAPPALVALAERLRAARYAVLVFEPARLPAPAGLLIETIQRIVASLNQTTRAAALPLGGDDGAATVNQTFAWLSGLPLRTRAGARGLEHEPHAFDGTRLLADGAVDLLLWLASFGTEPMPPATALPRILIGHPRLAEAVAAAPAGSVFIPVATPGIGHAGHLFRCDGTVLMPLHALRDDGLPAAAEVLRRLAAALAAIAGEPA